MDGDKAGLAFDRAPLRAQIGRGGREGGEEEASFLKEKLMSENI